MPAPRGRSETRQTPPGARPNRRAQPGSPGERRAAQPSGRLHEPSGNRRPQMDDRLRDASRGTELGLQAALAGEPLPIDVGPMTSPDALFHYSEDPSITTFVPRVPRSNPRQRAAVWAIDGQHAPLYWFPRDCPRVTVWANDDAQR